MMRAKEAEKKLKRAPHGNGTKTRGGEGNSNSLNVKKKKKKKLLPNKGKRPGGWRERGKKVNSQHQSGKKEGGGARWSV